MLNKERNVITVMLTESKQYPATRKSDRRMLRMGRMRETNNNNIKNNRLLKNIYREMLDTENNTHLIFQYPDDKNIKINKYNKYFKYVSVIPVIYVFFRRLSKKYIL